MRPRPCSLHSSATVKYFSYIYKKSMMNRELSKTGLAAVILGTMSGVLSYVIFLIQFDKGWWQAIPFVLAMIVVIALVRNSPGYIDLFIRYFATLFITHMFSMTTYVLLRGEPIQNGVLTDVLYFNLKIALAVNFGLALLLVAMKWVILKIKKAQRLGQAL